MVSASSKPLRGMRNVRLARADHRHVRGHVVDQKFRHAGFRIADHEHVGIHGFERVDGVQHALALGARARMQVQVEHVRAQAAAGEVEGGARAGARLEEQIGEGDAGEFAALIGRLAGKTAVALGAVENRRQRVARQAVERDEVAQAPRAVLL